MKKFVSCAVSPLGFSCKEEDETFLYMGAKKVHFMETALSVFGIPGIRT